MVDEAFRNTTTDLVHDLIYYLRDDTIEDIYSNIIKTEYQALRKKGLVERGTYDQLLQKYNKQESKQARKTDQV